MSNKPRKNTPSFYLYFVLPVTLMVLLYVSKALGPPFYDLYTAKEEGVIEWLTVVFFLIAAFIAWKIRSQKALPHKKFSRPFCIFIILGCLFVAGEELSWGQHILGWGTPEFLAEINKQNETNLHNILPIADFLDKYPRAILSIAITIYGIFGVYIYRTSFMASLRKIPLAALIAPDKILIPAAVMVIAPRLLNRLQVWFKFELPYAFEIPSKVYQEFQELAIATFGMIFLMMLYYRLKNTKADYGT